MEALALCRRRADADVDRPDRRVAIPDRRQQWVATRAGDAEVAEAWLDHEGVALFIGHLTDLTCGDVGGAGVEVPEVLEHFTGGLEQAISPVGAARRLRRLTHARFTGDAREP